MRPGVLYLLDAYYLIYIFSYEEDTRLGHSSLGRIDSMQG